MQRLMSRPRRVRPYKTHLHDAVEAPSKFAINGSPTSDGGEFTWTDPTYTGHSGLTGYKLYARPHGSGAYTEIAAPGFGSAPPYLVESLNPATAYDLYVTATIAQGESRPSNIIQVTTAA